MDADQREAKLQFISAFFDDIDERIQRLDRMLGFGFPEEAFILACCYIDSLAFFRKGNHAKRDDFIRLIFDYSGRKDFARISWHHFYNRGKDADDKGSSGTPMSDYTQIREVLLDQFGETCDHNKEMDKGGLIKLLKQRSLKLDYQNLEANLDKFSYAAVLYDKYRSAGVHRGRLAHTRDHKGKPVFQKNSKGEDVYYDGCTLCFSMDVIFEVLSNISQALRQRCLEDVKFPHELSE